VKCIGIDFTMVCLFFSSNVCRVLAFSIRVVFELFIDIIYRHLKLIKVNINDSSNLSRYIKKIGNLISDVPYELLLWLNSV